jgi:hypothetical protein
MMDCAVAGISQRDQVLYIVAGVAAKLLMMNFQIRHRATRLTPARRRDLTPLDADSHRPPDLAVLYWELGKKNRKSTVSWALRARSCITHLRGHEVIVSIERTSRQACHTLGEEVTR